MSLGNHATAINTTAMRPHQLFNHCRAHSKTFLVLGRVTPEVGRPWRGVPPRVGRAPWAAAGGRTRLRGFGISANYSKGFTLIEVLISSVIATTVAGGTMMAFVTAARIVGRGDSAAMLEASALAGDMLEDIRNQVAADSTWFADRVNLGWCDAPLPPSTSTESVLGPPDAERRYRVVRVDCTGDGDTNDPQDCFSVDVRVCWNGTECPDAGAGCPPTP